MIEADAVSRVYGDFVAVDRVSFEIGPRDIVGLLGHNGAGKTTIMKMIVGYLEPSSGTLTVNGQNVLDSQTDAQKDIGYLPENCPLYPDMTVIDYLEYVAELKSIPRSQMKKRIRHSIAKTSLRDVAMRPIATLSRGYRQRLGVAQAILTSPKLLILDEPTNGLDPSQILEMRALIKELAESATVVLSTHILQEVQAVCRRVIIINRGKLSLDERMEKLKSAGPLLLDTDLTPERFSKLAASEAGVHVIKAETTVDENYRYTIDTAGQKPRDVSAKLATAIVELKAHVYAMQPAMRDLETIFEAIRSGASLAQPTQASGKQAALAVGETTQPTSDVNAVGGISS